MSALPRKLLPFVRHHIKQQKWGFLASQLGALAWTLDHTIWPLIFMVVIDILTQFQHDRMGVFAALGPILLLGCALWLLIELGFRLGGIIFARVIPRMEASIRMGMFDYVQRHSFSYFSNQLAGSLSNKINDMPQSITRVLQLIITLFIPVVVAIAISTALFAWVNPWFAFILLSWVVMHMGVCFAFARKCDMLSLRHAEARSTLVGKIVDSLTNHLNVKLFCRFKEERQYIHGYQEIEQEKHWESLWFMEKIRIVLGVLAFIFPGVILTAYMLFQWRSGILSTGEVVFIMNSSWNIMIMVWLAGLELPNLFKEIGVAQQALTIIQYPHDIVDDAKAQDLIVKQGSIEFDDVTFHYTPGRALFRDKSLLINPGEKVGLVGFSGSGKTSFINLILRHFDVEKGKICIDGQDISTVTLDSLRRAIAMIPQEPYLFNRTLIENIRYGKLNATDEEIVDACKKAHAHDFIIKLSDGYATHVGERGIKLSGGQKQRIAIARAVLKNAPILILDEATSALDSITEKHIQEDLRELMQGRTTIVIAHRLSTIASMDRILVFENGQVIEEGSHEELLNFNGSYASMWRMQAGGFLPATADDEVDAEESFEF
jgi:ATP-binding cassette subfamily B protein